MNKKLKISLPILIVVIISVVVTMIVMNRNESGVSPGLSPESSQYNDSEEKVMNKMYISVNGQELAVNLEDNATAEALLGMLPLELTMNELNGNEKYTYLGEPLPVDTFNPGRVEAGDVMLFGDDCLVIFYESFETEYSYTKIGHVDGLPELGEGDVVVRLEAGR